MDPLQRTLEVLPGLPVLLTVSAHPINENVLDLLDYQKKAFDFAADLTKQLITLSTSIVTVTLLFGERFPKHSRLALWAWTLYLTSSVCGLWSLMALTGNLAPARTQPASFELRLNVRLPSAMQIFTFAAALVLTLIFVWKWY